MTSLIREQRYLLLKRLDVLSANLKTETDSIRADSILEEMRTIGKLLKELVSKPVSDHHFVQIAEFKKHGRDGYLIRQKGALNVEADFEEV